jgi:hypothetical protein
MARIEDFLAPRFYNLVEIDVGRPMLRDCVGLPSCLPSRREGLGRCPDENLTVHLAASPQLTSSVAGMKASR